MGGCSGFARAAMIAICSCHAYDNEPPQLEADRRFKLTALTFHQDVVDAAPFHGVGLNAELTTEMPVSRRR